MLTFINSTNDLIVIAIVAMIFFGANRIPELMRGLGQGMRELKKGMSEDDTDSRLSSYKSEEPLENREHR